MEYIDGEDLASLLKRIGNLHGAKALDVIAKKTHRPPGRDLQLRVFGFGLVEDWYVWISIFPDIDELCVIILGPLRVT